MEKKSNINFKKLQKASTLVKTILAITIASLILTIIIIATDPIKQLALTNNTKRNGDIVKIINAIHQYAADNQGLFPPELPPPGAEAKEISKSGVDLCHELVPKYLPSLPTDPLSPNGGMNTDCSDKYDTGYKISVGTTIESVTISAPYTQAPLAAIITETR